MFGKYTDITGTRTFLEAVGFYLFFTVLLVGISTTLVHVLGLVGVTETVTGFFVGGGLHTIIGSAWVLFLSSMIVSKRGLSKDMLSILLVVLGTYLSYDMGVLVGMIPVTILTMISHK